MEYNTELTKDLQALAIKHGLILMSGNPEILIKETKHLEGMNFFITKGEKKLILQGGEDMVYQSPTTIKILKNRYGS